MARSTHLTLTGLVLSAITILSAATALVPENPIIQCNLSPGGDVPVVSRRLPTKDLKSLFKISGYFSYPIEDLKFSFMDLFLIKLESKPGPNPNVTEFFADLSCANMTFTALSDDEGVKVQKASLQLHTPNKGHSSCELSKVSEWSAKKGAHYDCRVYKFYNCMAGDDIVVELALDGLEFEMGGDPNEHSAGVFSTPRQTCPSKKSSI